MDLPDVNVLIYAHREESAAHKQYKDWLTRLVNSPHAYAMSDQVLSSFIRIVTSPTVFSQPTPLPLAIEVAEELRSRPNCVRVAPGPRHWRLYTELCRHSQAKGNLSSDAWFAALAIEAGCEWVTTDQDFGRFAGLKWRHPLG